MTPNPENRDPLPPSTYKGIWKYPTNRDVPFRMPEDWLDAKRKDDDIESFWRVHDKIYDLSPFVKNHPGGSEWLTMTQGTDITEAFETSHIINVDLVEMILEKYYVRDATHPRISPNTFEPDGFYKTLKRRIAPVLKEIGTGPTLQILLIQDAMILFVLLFGALGAIKNCSLLAILSGMLLGLSAIGAHNFFHMRENLRKYYFDLTLLSSYEWRITHAFSHHLYTNTLMDIELTMFPTYQFLPNRPKPWIQRNFAILYSHLVYCISFWVELGKRICHVALGKKPLRLENLLILCELLALISISDGIGTALKTWILVHTASSYVFMNLAATAAHHHPDIFHDGDEPLPDPDFGIGQLDTTRDRVEPRYQNLFVGLVAFGEHPLHHLFPTVCHSKLAPIRKIFEDTVKEFKLDFPSMTHADLYFGVFKQLARTEVKKRKND